MDNTPDGRVACELSNWTRKAYKIPRNLFKVSADRQDLHKAGVYFLFGRDQIDPEINIAYIGEAEEATNSRPASRQRLLVRSRDLN